MQKRKPADRVYLIRNINEGVVEYKIGSTGRSAAARIQDMSTSNAGSMDVVAEYATPLALLLEGVLHRHYNAFRKKGEWFSSAAPLTAAEFEDTCAKLQDNVLLTQLETYKWAAAQNRAKPLAISRTHDELWDDILA